MLISLFAATAALLFATGASLERGVNPSHAQIVEITAFDYAFRLPDKIAAGRTTFRFHNNGKHVHELSIVLLKPGATIEQFVASIRDSASTTDPVEVPIGVLFAEPGGSNPAGLSTDLIGGRDYAVFCVVRDDRTAPRHIELGMFSVMHVRPGPPPASERRHVDTVVATDYAFRYPATLSAGRHTLAFRNAGTKRHELKVVLLREGVTLSAFIEARKQPVRDTMLVPRAMGLLHGQGGVTPGGMLELDLRPGREYALVCDFSDDANAPRHFALGMFGSIRVPAKKLLRSR